MGKGSTPFSGIRDHRPRIWNHKSWEKDQHLLVGSGSEIATVLGSGIIIYDPVVERTNTFMKQPKRRYTAALPLQWLMGGGGGGGWLYVRIAFTWNASIFRFIRGIVLSTCVK